MFTFDVSFGSIADWVSGIGSLSAVITTLYLSYTTNSVRLKCICDVREVIEGNRRINLELISIFVTNTGMRYTVISGFGLRFGLFHKQLGYVRLQQSSYVDPIPRPLLEGEQGHWGITLDRNRSWITDLFKKKFIRSRLDILTMTVLVHTTNGGVFAIRPTPEVRSMITAMWNEQIKLVEKPAVNYAHQIKNFVLLNFLIKWISTTFKKFFVGKIKNNSRAMY